MTAKTSISRTNAFFKALSETGNQTISAERACVSRSWVSHRRQRDPAFRARMEDCIAEARARLSGAGGVACAPVVGAKCGVIDGEELVLRGSNGRLAQVARARIGQITPRVEARFLSVLRRTCNVKMACVAVGISAAAAYNHRDRWAEFERAWDVAIQDGYFALEVALLENGIRALDPQADGLAEEPVLPMLPISADDAIRILGQRRFNVSGFGKRPGHKRRMPTEEETNAELLKRLRVLAMRDAAELSTAQRAWKGTG
ncbi:MAG: hypothetical protein ABL928_01055 [Sphingorhabdus sp.]